MNIVVTGYRGYLGSAVASLLIEEGHTVIGIDNDREGRVETVPGVDHHPMDVRDATGLVQDADAAIHLAGVAGIRQCEEYPIEATKVNVLGTAELAIACGRHNTPLIYASTIGVYGETEYIDGSQDRQASQFYMQTKRAGEDIIQAISLTSYPAATMQMGNLYGTHEVDGKTVTKPTVINYFIDLAKKGETLGVHEPGDQSRDFVHVEDAARAYLKAVEQIPDWLDGMAVIPIGSGQSVSIGTLASWIVAASQTECDVELVDRMDPPRYVGKIETAVAKQTIGWTADRGLMSYIVEELND